MGWSLDHRCAASATFSCWFPFPIILLVGHFARACRRTEATAGLNAIDIEGVRAVGGRIGLPKGVILDGTYRIERVIGSGGFGVTYEAADIKLLTKVGIKEYFPAEFGHREADLTVGATSEKEKATFEWGRASFMREAQTLARFRHPSIVQVTRVFEAYSTAYMVMIFEEGKSLEAWLRDLGREPTQDELDRIGAPLLDALEMMHRESFLHRDVAPDNIIVRADGTPVLLDFGAARRALADRSHSVTGIIKSGYSPQEQYTTDGRLQGPWTDLYAFGATLYRAVAGNPPQEATQRMMDDRVVPAESAAQGTYRAGFLRSIDTCLRVRPEDRPQAVAEIRGTMFGRPGATDRTHVTSRKTRETKLARNTASRKWWWTAPAAIVVFAAGYGGVEYRRWEASRGANGEIEARTKAEEEKQRQAHAAAVKRAEEEARARAQEEAEAKRKAEEEAKRKSDAAAAKKKAEEEALTKPREEPGARSAVEEASAIRPGRGIGPVTIGMDAHQVRAVLGEPEEQRQYEKGKILFFIYKQRGLSVRMENSATTAIFAYSGRRGGYETGEFAAYNGSIQEGLGLNSRYEEVIAKYGSPNRADTNPYAPIPYRWMQYEQRGIGFSFIEKTGEIIVIDVFRQR